MPKSFVTKKTVLPRNPKHRKKKTLEMCGSDLHIPDRGGVWRYQGDSLLFQNCLRHSGYLRSRRCRRFRRRNVCLRPLALGPARGQSSRDSRIAVAVHLDTEDVASVNFPGGIGTRIFYFSMVANLWVSRVTTPRFRDNRSIFSVVAQCSGQAMSQCARMARHGLSHMFFFSPGRDPGLCFQATGATFGK